MEIQLFNFSVDLIKASLWQYDQATNLQGLLNQKAEWYNENQTDFWQNWIRDVFFLDTANDFGLTVWGIILGQPLYVNIPNENRPTWGFEEFHRNFERGNFSPGSSQRLRTETARILLKLRYVQLISSGTIPESNRRLAWVFKDYGPVWVNDLYDMTQFVTFGFPIPSDLLFIFNNFDVLPRPAGVGSDYRVVVGEAWGFDADHENFDHGNFSEL